MITIGRLAEYAGVTIKAIRHYHRLGLLAEPPRDSSGYRNYSAADALTLVKIRTLAEAGVPLARVKDLLAADPDQFNTAIAEIDRTLQKRAEDIHRTRDRLAHLRAGDRLFLGPAVVGYLDRLRDLGVSQRAVQMERDGWILMQSVSPDQAAAWLADKLDAIDDPEFAAIYRDYDGAFDWSPDDPRLLELAVRTGRWLADHQATRTDRPGKSVDPKVARLAEMLTTPSSPAWDRLAEFAKQHDDQGRIHH
jgi:DNA-binding transcriptional MerR regulator